MKNKLLEKIGSFIDVTLTLLIPFMLIGIYSIYPNLNLDNFLGFMINGFFIPFLIFYLIITFSIILHELGHLIMGLLSNLDFKEYNFLVFSIIKENNKVKFKFKGLIGGVGGFCRFNFPDNMTNTDYIKMCYGGPITNIILAIIGLILFLTNIVPNYIALIIISTNLGFAINNLIPSETKSGIDTDGMKIYKIKHDSNYVKTMVNNEKVIELLKSGKTINEISDLIYKPEKLIYSSDFMMLNLYICKLVLNNEFNEAEILVKEVLDNKDCSYMYKCAFKVSLIDIYIKTKRFDLIKNVLDKNLFSYLMAVSTQDNLNKIYVLLYYLINNDQKNINKVNNELELYFNKLDLNNSINKDYYELYNLIKENYNIK